MATYKKCDRCGKSTEYFSDKKFTEVNIEVPPGTWGLGGDINKEICDDCFMGLRKWLETITAAVEKST